jgi:hypothetical protein
MNAKSIFTIVAIVAAIEMLGMAAVAIPSVPQAHADKGGAPNSNAGDVLSNTATPIMAERTTVQ